ncbi:NeuD/PglB/VioB family sugar acetyltransferase [Dietzia sp. SL131]|uniref:NeuD/PglB/VioB family sugar acetyltransferase n=1 Tax=Dietzia sp. SL131 TaxID=2995149 RepID=UPI003FA34F25
MTRIVIVGAGGFGRGVFSWISSSPRHLEQFGIRSIVHVDDDPNARAETEIVGRIVDYRPQEDDRVVCAIALPLVRRQIVSLLSSRSAKFHTFVDDRSTLAPGVHVGDGSIICPGTVVSTDARIGDHVHINFNCSIGHDTRIDAYSTLSPSVNLMGEVAVAEGAFFGGSSTVLPRIAVGKSAIVGAGSVVNREVLAGATVVGNPASAIVRRGDR